MPAFFLESVLTCARCGNTAPPSAAPHQVETGGTLRVVNEVACTECDDKIEFLIEALVGYGNHKAECAVAGHVENACDCGWDELFLALASYLVENVKEA